MDTTNSIRADITSRARKLSEVVWENATVEELVTKLAKALADENERGFLDGYIHRYPPLDGAMESSPASEAGDGGSTPPRETIGSVVQRTEHTATNREIGVQVPTEPPSRRRREIIIDLNDGTFEVIL